MPEVEIWPWCDETSGYKMQENLWYAIGDSGSIAAADCERRQSAVLQTIRDSDYLKVDNIGWLPEHLGDYAVTVLTGRQYVDRLKVISENNLSDYGHWS